MKKNRSFSTYDIVAVGMSAAVIFAATFFLKIGPIPLPVGDPTMLKMANAFCLMAGLLFGGLRGGLAAGIGSAMFDLTNPVYVRSAPFTLFNFFMMGFVCGCIAHAGGAGGENKARNLTGAVLGALTYSTLYITKSVAGLVLAGSSFQAALVSCIPKMCASGANAIFAVVVSILIAPYCRKALVRSGLQSKLFAPSH